MIQHLLADDTTHNPLVDDTTHNLLADDTPSTSR